MSLDCELEQLVRDPELDQVPLEASAYVFKTAVMLERNACISLLESAGHIEAAQMIKERGIYTIREFVIDTTPPVILANEIPPEVLTWTQKIWQWLGFKS